MVNHQNITPIFIKAIPWRLSNEMNLQQSQNTILELMSKFVAQVKSATALNRTDILRLSQTVLIPLFAEIYGLKHLRNLDYTDEVNYPGIDLGDDEARVAIQVTATPTAEKIKRTLDQFIKRDLYSRYDRLIIYILTEKLRSYSGRGYEDIIRGKFRFDKDSDVWDYRDLIRDVGGFDIERSRLIEGILRRNFDNMSESENRAHSVATHFQLGNLEVSVGLYTQLLDSLPRAEYFIGRGKCHMKLAANAHRKGRALAAPWKSQLLPTTTEERDYQRERSQMFDTVSDYERKAYKDFSDAIAVSDSIEMGVTARKQRLHMQAVPFDYRVGTDWTEDIDWLKKHVDESEWGEVLYLEALSYSWDSYLFSMGSCQIPDWQEKALACLEKAIILGYDCPEVYFLRSQAHHSGHNFGLALSDVNKAIETDSEGLLAKALCLKGNILVKMYEFDAAYKVYQEFRKRFQSIPDYLDALWRIEEVLFCGYALTSEYIADESPVTIQGSGETIWASVALNSGVERNHPKTSALLRKKLGALPRKPNAKPG